MMNSIKKKKPREILWHIPNILKVDVINNEKVNSTVKTCKGQMSSLTSILLFSLTLCCKGSAPSCPVRSPLALFSVVCWHPPSSPLSQGKLWGEKHHSGDQQSFWVRDSQYFPWFHTCLFDIAIPPKGQANCSLIWMWKWSSELCHQTPESVNYWEGKNTH